MSEPSAVEVIAVSTHCDAHPWVPQRYPCTECVIEQELARQHQIDFEEYLKELRARKRAGDRRRAVWTLE